MVKTLPKVRARAKTKAAIVAEAGLESPHPAHTQVVVPQCQPIPGPKMVLYCSDCSALDGAAVALRRLRPYMAHVFGSESAPSHCSAFAVLHPRCEKLYNGLLERENWMLQGDLPHSPLISLVYAANCTAHAMVEDGKATPAMWQICDTIRQLFPDIFLLELVPELIESKPLRTPAQKFLDALVEARGFAYYVGFRVVDSLKVGEVPATRQRMYLVGVKKHKLLQQWQWPETCPAPKYQRIKGMWVTHLKDNMTPMELLKCQGFRPEEVEKVVQETCPSVVHETTGKRQVLPVISCTTLGHVSWTTFSTSSVRKP